MPASGLDHRIAAQRQWGAGRLDRALSEAWQALDAAPDDRAAKVLVARLLAAGPELAAADRQPALRRLLNDRDIDPRAVAPAGWLWLLRNADLFAADAIADPAAMAARLEACGFAQELLAAAIVTNLDIELKLTGLRRWLLLSGRWHDFPRTVEALIRHVDLSGGAWLFDAEERARLDADPSAAMVRAYRVARPREAGPAAEPAMRALAAQYEGWPYPPWRRVMVGRQTTLPAEIRALDPDGPDTLPQAARILIAGCGTGRQAALQALRYPDAHITAIDISTASLRYAASRCGEAGLGGIEFRALDLRHAATLGRRFDAIFCAGVLQNLPDPEAGWAALAECLEPGGVMRVMVYSKLARLRVQALQTLIADLLDRPVDDDLLREVRRRIIARDPAAAPVARDFYSLAGVYDLLVQGNIDSFDVPRIGRALDRLGLHLIHFALPTPQDRARYRAENPHDPLHRDFAAWSKAEWNNPDLFAGMYDFWCRKPAA